MQELNNLTDLFIRYRSMDAASHSDKYIDEMNSLEEDLTDYFADIVHLSA